MIFEDHYVPVMCLGNSEQVCNSLKMFGKVVRFIRFVLPEFLRLFRTVSNLTMAGELGGLVWVPQPTERHADLLDDLLTLPGLQANLVTDAHMAALALEHGSRCVRPMEILPDFQNCIG